MKSLLLITFLVSSAMADTYEKVDSKTMRVISPKASLVSVKELKRLKASLEARKAKMTEAIDARLAEIETQLTEATKLNVQE